MKNKRIKIAKKISYDELYHYGVKGQKWGVRRSPEQLGHIAKRKKNNIMDYMGKHKNVNDSKQVRHVKNKFFQGRSHLDGDLEFAQSLINTLSGTGELKFDRHGNWVNKEIVTANKTIGTYINPDTGEETQSNKAVIVYSKTGAHIYPVRPSKEKEN